MSLPSSERLPSDINDLPPARRRHIRRQPRTASLPERQILLDSLVKLTAPTPAFFLQTFLGAVAIWAAFFLHNLALLIVAIVILPFLSPLFGLVVYPITLNVKHAVKSLISLVILLVFVFGAGVLAGLFRRLPYPDLLGIFRFSALYWLDLTIVGMSAIFSTLILLRQGKIPLGMGVLLSYTLLIPFAAVGFGLSSGHTTLWSGALFVGFIHLGLAFVLSVLTFLILGFPPKKAVGWLLALATLIITMALASASMNLNNLKPSSNTPAMAPSPTRLFIISDTPVPQVESIAITTSTPTSTHTSTYTPTSVTRTPTGTASPSPTNTPTITPEPIVRWGVVNSVIGAIIRQDPDFSADILTYANNGDRIELLGEITREDGSRWFQVSTGPDQIGWLLASLVQTQTPAPTETE